MLNDETVFTICFLLTLVIILVLVGAHINSVNVQEAIAEEPEQIAKVKTIWGCKETIKSVGDFDKEQKLLENLYGFRYERCD